MDPLALRSLIESTTSCTVDSYMKTYSGIATFFRTKYDPSLSATDIALVGLPIDAGLTQRTGARHGPREVRNQSCNVLYFNPLTKVNPLALCPGHRHRRRSDGSRLRSRDDHRRNS